MQVAGWRWLFALNVLPFLCIVPLPLASAVIMCLLKEDPLAKM